MPKIIQIITQYNSSETEADILGLSDTGALYYWGREQIKLEGDELKQSLNDGDGEHKYIYGWKLMKNEINN